MSSRTYPHPVGDFYAIGPDIVSTTARPEPGTVINWAGENFTLQPCHGHVPAGWLE